MRVLRTVLIVLGGVLMVMPSALAQDEGSIAGVVRDASGAVLPGVTVEAASPVLIEKVRSAATDVTGYYRIVGLRPGTYTAVFTLSGFSTARHEGIEITGASVITVNADMKVGAVAETLTVIGEAPTVDVQSTRRQTSYSGDIINSLPSAKSYAMVAMLIPSIISTGGGRNVQTGPDLIVFGGAGGRPNEGRMQVDGLGIGAPFNGAGTSRYVADLQNSSEVVTTTSGGMGEAEVGGPTINVVPKEGGNRFSGIISAAGLSGRMVGGNYTEALRAAGLSSPSTIDRLWDINPAFGGPIKKDRVWFFLNYRDQGQWNTVPGLFANKNFNTLVTPNASNLTTPWNYVADTTRPAYTANSWTIAGLRLTTQVTPRNKVNVFWDHQVPCNGSTWTPTGKGCRQMLDDKAILYTGVGAPLNAAPESGGYWHRFQRNRSITWQSPVSSRLLLETGFGGVDSPWGTNRRPDTVTDDLVRVTEGCSTAAGCSASPGSFPGLTYRGETGIESYFGQYNWRASATYLAGRHSVKVGYQGGYLIDDRGTLNNSTASSYTLQNASANSPQVSITQTLTPLFTRARVQYASVFVQDQWAQGRFTFQGAVRFDHESSFFPDQQVGPVRFLPTPVVFAQDDPLLTTPSTLLCSGDLKGSNLPAGFSKTCSNQLTGYKDLTPRGGIAWDVTGTGKTAVKLSIGRYLNASSTGSGVNTAGNPLSRMVTTVTRTWIDANDNFIPDCDLLQSTAQDRRSAGGDLCGVISNQNFGKPVFTNSFDSALMGGWGVRPGDWGFVASVQQQLLPRTSVEFSYTRRWLQNFTTTDNILQSATDFTSFSIVAPVDSRLPNGGGQTISNLYNVNPTINGVANTLLINNFETRAGNYGNQYERYNGLLMSLSSRMANGLNVQGGFNIGKTVSDSCEIRAQVPETAPTNPYCHVDLGWQKRFTALAAYTVPKVLVLVSGTFRSEQGDPLAANYAVPNAAIVPSLGRPLSNNASFVSVNLIEPGTLRGNRIHELDLRVAKVLRFGRTRTNVGVELFNALNSSAVLIYNQSFNPNVTSGSAAWLAPRSILIPRFVKVSAQFDF